METIRHSRATSLALGLHGPWTHSSATTFTSVENCGQHCVEALKGILHWLCFPGLDQEGAKQFP